MSVDAVVYYRVSNATVSVANVENAHHSTRLLAQTTLRNILGTKNLHEILSDRESISGSMQVSDIRRLIVKILGISFQTIQKLSWMLLMPQLLLLPSLLSEAAPWRHNFCALVLHSGIPADLAISHLGQCHVTSPVTPLMMRPFRNASAPIMHYLAQLS